MSQPDSHAASVANQMLLGLGIAQEWLQGPGKNRPWVVVRLGNWLSDLRWWLYDRLNRCPGCGGPASDNWFDRSPCPEPCGSMHTCCSNCGAALDYCPFERQEVA